MTEFFKQPTDFNSIMGYGAMSQPVIGELSGITGANGLPNAGVDLSNWGVAAPSGISGWGSGINDWLQNSGFLGKTENGVTTQGWGGAALGVAQGLGNTFMGMKQYGLAKDQLAQSKKQFDLNFGAQQKTTNSALADRQAARVASNPGAYQSVGDYMKKNGI